MVSKDLIKPYRNILATFVALICFVLTTGVASAAPVVSSADVEESEEAVSSDATPQEIKLGKKGVEEVEKHWPLVKNPVLQARVETIVNRLKPYMSRNLNYEVRIVDQKMVNAFSLSGGTMYVCTGMLDFVKTDLELAGVIAHEMVHADRKHVITQIARNNRMTLIALAALIATRGQAGAMIMTNALQVAVMGAYSIDIEKEADAYGIDALMKAGYNPVGVLTLQERLDEESLKRAYFDPGIAQTHPDTKERIAAAVRYMEDRHISINRKYALGVLRTNVDVVSGDLALIIDGSPVWRGRDDEPTRALLSRVAASLWDELQLETAPYDIRVESDGTSSSLQIKGKKIARSNELPQGLQPLPSFREGIQNALNAARRAHPLADYYL